MKVCEKCGAQLEDNAQFCVGCGSKVEAKVEAKVEEKAKSPFAPKSGSKKVLGLDIKVLIPLCAAAVVVVIALVVAFLASLFWGTANQELLCSSE